MAPRASKPPKKNSVDVDDIVTTPERMHNEKTVAVSSGAMAPRASKTTLSSAEVDDVGTTPEQLHSAKGIATSRFTLLLRELQAEHEAELVALRKHFQSTSPPGISSTPWQGKYSTPASNHRTSLKTTTSHFSLHSALDASAPAKTQSTRRFSLFERHNDMTHSSFFHRIVFSKWFELVCSSIVVMHSMVMAFETQYDGHGVGHALEYSGHRERAEDYYPRADVILSTLSWVFGCVYVVEFLLRVFASPHRCIMDGWSWFDFIIIVIWIISQFGQAFKINSSFLRIARVARLLRLLKIARALEGLDSLVIITTALRGCVSVLFWTFLVFGLFQLFCALLVAQYLHTFYFEDGPQNTDQVLVFQYFGTFNRAYFSLWEITLGNWPPASRVLAENVGEAFFVIGILHKIIIGFAVVAIINGVFMQQTFTVAAMDDSIMVRRRQTAVEYHRKKMGQLWNEADISGDGEITLTQWHTLLENPVVKTWLSSMELDPRDASLVFELLDESNDGYVSFEELVAGVSKLKGAARSIDLHALALEHQKLCDHMCAPARFLVDEPEYGYGNRAASCLSRDSDQSV